MEDSKKENILSACIEEFAEHGYERANTNRICASAGVSKGLIFHYFGSKQQLFMMALEKCVADILHTFNNISIDEQDFISSILKYSANKCEYFSDNPQCYKFMLKAFYDAPQELQAEMSKKLTEVHNLSANIVIELIMRIPLKPDVNREQASSLIMAVINMLESKYIPILCNQGGFYAEQYRAIEKEYAGIMQLILYGIADEKQ